MQVLRRRVAAFRTALAERAIPPFLGPLIEPDMTIPVIRLSDGFQNV